MEITQTQEDCAAGKQTGFDDPQFALDKRRAGLKQQDWSQPAKRTFLRQRRTPGCPRVMCGGASARFTMSGSHEPTSSAPNLRKKCASSSQPNVKAYKPAGINLMSSRSRSPSSWRTPRRSVPEISQRTWRPCEGDSSWSEMNSAKRVRRDETEIDLPRWFPMCSQASSSRTHSSGKAFIPGKVSIVAVVQPGAIRKQSRPRRLGELPPCRSERAPGRVTADSSDGYTVSTWGLTLSASR
ncbi:hypothetical protein OKW50_002739 [Paraburkholderia youngii]